MKDDIEHFPLSIFQTALNTVVGGFIVMFVATDIGAWFGWYAVTGDLPDLPDDWLWIAFLNFAPLFTAIISGWGVLYLAVLGVIGFKLIYDEAPRLRYGCLLVVMHYICTLLMPGDWVRNYHDEKFLLRLLGTSLALAGSLLLLFMVYFIWRWWWTRRAALCAQAGNAIESDAEDVEPNQTNEKGNNPCSHE